MRAVNDGRLPTIGLLRRALPLLVTDTNEGFVRVGKLSECCSDPDPNTDDCVLAA